MARRNGILFTFALLLVLLPALVSAQSIALKTAYEDIEPKFMKGSDGKITGLCVELMDLITKDTGITFSSPNTFAAKKRFQADLESGAIDVMFGMKKDAEREKIYVFGEPLYSIKYVALARKSDPVVIKDVQDIPKLGQDSVVMTVFGAASVEFLKGKGLNVDDGSKDVDQGIAKLVEKRGRFFIYQNLSTMFVLNRSQYKNDVKVIPMDIDNYDHFVAFSKTVSPDTIKKIAASIQKLKKSGAWQKVTDKYL